MCDTTDPRQSPPCRWRKPSSSCRPSPARHSSRTCFSPTPAAGSRTPPDTPSITDPGTPLAVQAGELGIRHLFENQPDIGGRYSVLSHFGLVPAALMGYDVAELCERALDVDREEAVALGEDMGRAALAGRDKTTIVVDEKSRSFGLWVEQLIAESTGKQGRGIVPVPTTEDEQGEDRHVIKVVVGAPADLAERVLPLRAGHRDRPAMSSRSTPSTSRTWPSRRRTPRGCSAPCLCRRWSRRPRRTSWGSSRRTVRPHDYVSLQAYLPFGQDDELEALRRRVRDANGEMAVTVGYGPRFLHSTGQLHKGGPNTVVAVQLVRSRPSGELRHPGRDLRLRDPDRSTVDRRPRQPRGPRETSAPCRARAPERDRAD